jgi:hypothetical protein
MPKGTKEKLQLDRTISVTEGIDKKLKLLCAEYDLFEYEAVDAALDLLAKGLKEKAKQSKKA